MFAANNFRAKEKKRREDAKSAARMRVLFLATRKPVLPIKCANEFFIFIFRLLLKAAHRLQHRLSFGFDSNFSRARTQASPSELKRASWTTCCVLAWQLSGAGNRLTRVDCCVRANLICSRISPSFADSTNGLQLNNIGACLGSDLANERYLAR